MFALEANIDHPEEQSDEGSRSTARALLAPDERWSSRIPPEAGRGIPS
jgi:hypothetical protein